MISVIQPRKELSAAITAFTASATPTLVLHTIELAALATPAVRRGPPGDGLGSLSARACPAVASGPSIAPAGFFVTSYAWVGPGAAPPGSRGAAGIVTFSLLPILLPAGCRVAARDGPGARGSPRDRSAWGVAHVRARRPAATCAPLLGGVLLVLLDTLVEFDAFVALKFQTLSVNIYSQYQAWVHAAGAAALSLLDADCRGRAAARAWVARGGANYSPDQPGRSARRGALSTRPEPADCTGR